jgi:hypothetical protein
MVAGQPERRAVIAMRLVLIEQHHEEVIDLDKSRGRSGLVNEGPGDEPLPN